MIEFATTSSAKQRLAAIYCEMNGFTINPDNWHFAACGYYQEGGLEDLDWLAYWDAESNKSMTLTSMESVQSAFAELYLDQRTPLRIMLAGELAEYLVTARFMQLMAAAHASAKHKSHALDGMPVLATAHDWDTVYRSV